jgi:hypothetical protein
MNIKKILFVISLFFMLNANADYYSFSITYRESGETKKYELNKSKKIDLKLNGWLSCTSLEPQSYFMSDIKAHVRRLGVQCHAESGVSLMLICAIPDGKNKIDGDAVTIFPIDNQVNPNKAVQLSLICGR